MPEELTKKSTTELVGVLQAISVVASDMAGRLMKLQREVERREAESGLCGKSCQRQPTAKSCRCQEILQILHIARSYSYRSVPYGFYGLKPGERIKFTKKENGKKVSKVVKVVKEYPYFILVEVAGRMGNYCTSINKSWIFTKEALIARV